jgi:hypothetical protein
VVSVTEMQLKPDIQEPIKWTTVATFSK